MSDLPRVRTGPESGIVRRDGGSTLGLAVAHLAAAAECDATLVFGLEGDELLPCATGGELATLRIGPDEQRAIARPMVTGRTERAARLTFLPAGLQHALLVPLAADGEVIGVACLAYRHEPPADLGCDGAIELTGIALANELRRSRVAGHDQDLHELSRLASLGMLLVGVAHQLRGPAGALALLVPQVAAALESAEKRPGEARGLVRDLQGCAERILDLAGQLRGAGRKDGRRTVVDLCELTRDAVGIARIHAPEVSFSVSDCGGPVEVSGVRAELDQVVLNLLLNAVDACRSQEGGARRVDVVVIADDDGATLALSDSGPGVRPELEARIFERFFTTKPRGAGTGVGLSVSREIVEAHGGELTLVPSRGGATFMVRLPTHAREAGRPMLVRTMGKPTRQNESSEGPDKAPRVRVLLVDDDPLVLRTHRRALAAFDVRGASSVAEAARELASGEIDIVISDLGMVDGGGVALHHWMVEHLGAARPPMLFLTGGITSDRTQAAVDATGCRCLTKPTPMDALATAIRHAVRDRRA